MEMDSWEYVVDESRKRDRQTNILLDYEGYSDKVIVNPALTDPSEQALASIALAIHLNGSKLNPEHAEKAVTWLKRAKRQKLEFKRTGGTRGDYDFAQTLNSLRNNVEQVGLQKRAYRHTIWARLWALVCGLSVAVTLGLFAVDNVAWWAWAIAVIANLTFFGISDVYAGKALDVSKEQERRYFLQSVREAERLSELLDTGLFSYLPFGYAPGQPYNAYKATVSLAKAHEALSDALYFDDNGLLDSASLHENPDYDKTVLVPS